MSHQQRWPALLLQLRTDAWTRALDLAAALGVSESTVYRDVQGLVDAGVPVDGVPGKGYRLPPDYFVAPITLTVDEAVMLVLGSAYAAQNFDGRYRAAARAAQRKLEDVLPREDREHAFALQGSVHLVPPSAFGNPTEDALLHRIRQALVEERTARLVVDTPAGPEQRQMDPYGLVRQGSTWHLVGYGHERGRVQCLRLDDVDRVALADATFERPDGYRTAPGGPNAAPDRTVRVVFASEVAPSVQVAPSIQVDASDRLPDGRLLLTLKVYHVLELLPWLLSWGAHVRILEPQALKHRIAAEARRVAAQYVDEPNLLDDDTDR